MGKDRVKVMVVRCCVCGKERVDGEWVEPPEPDDESAERLAVSHSYCPECVEAVRAEIAELLAS